MKTDSDTDQSKLRITEIFYSLQGEANTVGIPTVFVRLTGCPLRCQYCDTEYAFSGGNWMTIAQIRDEISQFQTHYVTITGGEPLAQKACVRLLEVLCEQGYRVSLETSGAMDISGVDPRVSKVMDIKTPGSGETDKMNWRNIDSLTQNDQVKFVVCDRHDYDWAIDKLQQYQLTERCEVLFSPSYEQLAIRDLAEWVLADQLPVRVQIQLHKHIWGNLPGV